MSNTSKVYGAVRDYMNTRASARQVFLNRKAELARAKGSQLYAKEMDKAKKKREETVSAARAAAEKTVNDALKNMTERADRIEAIAPDDNMVRILQVLALHEQCSQTDLNMAARAMHGNAVGLSLIGDLARRNGYGNGAQYLNMCKDLTASQAVEAVRDLAAVCSAIFKNTSGANAARLLAAEAHQRAYGGTVDPDDMPQETGYASERDFYTRNLHVDFDVLCRAVND